MNTRIIHRYDMFGRVIVFGQDNTADFAAGSTGATHFANLAVINQQLVASGATQKGGSVSPQNALLLTLDTELQNIARTASAIAQDEPGFADLFAPPTHYNPHEVLATADQFLTQLAAQPGDDAPTAAAKTARVAKFVAHALPATFVTDMQATVTAIGAAQGAHESGRETGVASTSAVARLARAGMKEVNYLDAIVRNKYAGNGDKLAAWDSASHIERGPVHPAKPAPAPTAKA
jgi:hypothetical protein